MDKAEERILTWLQEDELEDIEDQSLRTDILESDQESENSTDTPHSSSDNESEVSFYFT